MKVRGSIPGLVLITSLVAGCASGPLGARPELRDFAGGDGQEDITVTSEVRDADETPCSLTVEYSTDAGATWNAATITSASAGTFDGNTISGLDPGDEWTLVTLVWDSWADDVGKVEGGTEVTLRVIARDADGTADPVESAPFTVDNFLPVLNVLDADVAFHHGLGNALNPADQTVRIRNDGPAPMNWTFSIAYAGAGGWLSSPEMSGVTASGDTGVATLRVDPIGQGLGEGTYEATITVDDPDARDAPQEVTVTITVSRPVLKVVPTAFTFDEAVKDIASTEDKTFRIRTTGPSYTTLYWTIDDAGFPAWLSVTSAKSGTVAGGASATVTLHASYTNEPAGSLTHAVTVEDAKDPDVADIVSGTVSVTLPVREQRPEVEVSDDGATGWTTDIALATFTCVTGDTGLVGTDSFWIRNSSAEPASVLYWTADDDIASGTWLSYSPEWETDTGGIGTLTPGGATQQVDVTVDLGATPLSPGHYYPTITIMGHGADDHTLSDVPRTVTVHLWVKRLAEIGLAPQTLSFTQTGTTGAIEEVKNPTTATKNITLSNTGEIDLNWSTSGITYTPAVTAWLSVNTGGVANPLTPGSNGQVTFTVDPYGANLLEGTYQATIDFTDTDGKCSNSPQTVTVTLDVQPRAEIVCAEALSFSYELGGSGPTDQTLVLSNPGASGLVWTAADGNYNPAMAAEDEWLSVTSGGTTSGGGTSNLTVSIDTSGIASPGTYEADITITGTDQIGGQAAKGSPTTVHVVLEVTADYALSFDADDCVVFLGGSDLFPTTGFTWECWVKLDNGPRNYCFAALDTAWGQDISLDTYDTGGGIMGVRLVVYDSAWNGQSRSANYAPLLGLDLGRWYHFAGVADYPGNELRIYVDGQLRGQSGWGLNPITRDITAFIGKHGESVCKFEGVIDEVRVWDHARTQAQIAASMNAPLVGGETGLVAYWDFNEGSGQIVYDQTGNGYDGTRGKNGSVESFDPTWTLDNPW